MIIEIKSVDYRTPTSTPWNLRFLFKPHLHARSKKNAKASIIIDLNIKCRFQQNWWLENSKFHYHKKTFSKTNNTHNLAVFKLAGSITHLTNKTNKHMCAQVFKYLEMITHIYLPLNNCYYFELITCFVIEWHAGKKLHLSSFLFIYVLFNFCNTVVFIALSFAWVIVACMEVIIITYVYN